MADDRFLPALAYHSLTGLYDPVVRLTTREIAHKGALLQQARLAPGQRVLDVGCGSGTLAIMAKAAYPEVDMTGVDADDNMLGLARGKAELQDVAIRFDQALASELPYENQSFDRVLSSLFFHHLKRSERRRAMFEMRRVLKPGGELHIADWGQPENLLMRAAFLSVQLLDGFDYTGDVVAGCLMRELRELGFRSVAETRVFRTVLGTLSLYRAVRPVESLPGRSVP